jgi:hypothetical protein
MRRLFVLVLVTPGETQGLGVGGGARNGPRSTGGPNQSESAGAALASALGAMEMRGLEPLTYTLRTYRSPD